MKMCDATLECKRKMKKYALEQHYQEISIEFQLNIKTEGTSMMWPSQLSSI